MLTLSHVSKSYGKFPAVEDISLEMEHGLYGMLAPNGAGKTTLIKMIATLLVPTQGEILWDGIPVAKLGEKYRDLLGYLPQQFGYYKNNTPVQYLDYLAALKNMPKQTAKEKIEQLLELVGLSDVADKKMKKFSGGMIQRVGIAQAMLNDPKVLILDEPTAGLDPKERARFRNILSTLSKDRIVILSTHILTEVQAVCDHILMIEEGKLVFSGSVDEFDNYIMPNSIYLSMVDAPTKEELERIEGVLGVEELGNMKFRIRFTEAQEVIDRIVKQSAANDWRLSEIRVEKSSLDTIFAELSKKAH